MGHLKVLLCSEKSSQFTKLKNIFLTSVVCCCLFPFIRKKSFGHSALEWHYIVWKWVHEVIKFTDLSGDAQFRCKPVFRYVSCSYSDEFIEKLQFYCAFISSAESLKTKLLISNRLKLIFWLKICYFFVYVDVVRFWRASFIRSHLNQFPSDIRICENRTSDLDFNLNQVFDLTGVTGSSIFCSGR